jgi:drug/metabolite transporter (DMT)-like permease
LQFQAIPYIVSLGVLFGTTLVVSRFSVGQFAPSTYIGLRLMMASLGFALVYATGAGRRRLPKDQRLWKHASVLGVLGSAIPMTAIVTSLQYQSSGVTSLLITANPAMTALMAHFALADERLNLRKIAGVILAFSGTLLMLALGESGLPDVEQANPIGYGLVLAGMFCGSAATIYARKFMRDLNTFDVAGVRMFAAAAVVMPLSMAVVGFDLSHVNTQGLLALVYAALIGTFLGFILQFYNIQRFGAMASVMAAYVIPVVAGVVGALLLKETITLGMLWGMALIAGGVFLIN